MESPEPLTPEALAAKIKADHKAMCAFRRERLNWRLRRAFEDCFPGRAFQRPYPQRPLPLAVEPKGFG